MNRQNLLISTLISRSKLSFIILNLEKTIFNELLIFNFQNRTIKKILFIENSMKTLN